MGIRLGTSKAVLPLLLLGAGGCYTLEPVQQPRTGSDVRVRLTMESAIQRSQGMVDPVLSVDGRIVDASGEGLALDVLIARDPSVFMNVEIRDTVRLATNEIETVLERRLSPGRTALASVAAAAGAFLVIKGITVIAGGTTEGDPGDPTVPASVVPVVSLRHGGIGWLEVLFGR